MGERVQVGGLIYTILHTDWKDQLGEAVTAARVPTHRFLLVHLTVTNGGGTEAPIPPLVLVDQKGQTHQELSSGEGVPDWLGMIRLVKPASTDEGQILFDVPRGAYKLQVSEGGDPEQEKTALVDLPLSLDPQAPVPVPAVPGLGAPGTEQSPGTAKQ